MEEQRSGGREKEIEVEAQTVELAVARAAEKLGCPRRHVRYKILREGRTGLLGLGRQPALIRAWFHDSAGRQVDRLIRDLGDIDGQYTFTIEGRELLLEVHPPLGKGKPADPDVVIGAGKDFEPEILDEEKIREVVGTAAGVPVVVGRLRRAGERDGSLLLSVSEDGMRAEGVLLPAKRGGKDLDVDGVLRLLEKEGIRFGIDLGRIQKVVFERAFNTNFIIAEGRPPVPGRDGEIEYLFERNRHRIDFEEDEKGRVDYRELDLIESVTAGQELVRLIPPEDGTPGKNVFGEDVPAPRGTPAELPPGEQVIRAGDVLRAGIDGHVIERNGRVIVSPIVQIKGDVNYETGNIDFEGTVSVEGVIEDTFSVRAGGSLFVKKSIGKCRVDVGGNLVVIGGILGRYEAEITVGGDLVALFIENSRVTVGGDLRVGEVILHSTIFVDGGLEMAGGARGALIGGEAVVGGNVDLLTVGGEGTSRTILRAGAPPALVRREMEIDARLKELIDKRERLIKTRKAVQREAGLGDPRLKKLELASGQLKAEINNLREELKIVRNTIAQTGEKTTIGVRDIAVPGTRIQIGSASMVLKTVVRYARFRRVGNEITIGSYN